VRKKMFYHLTIQEAAGYAASIVGIFVGLVFLTVMVARIAGFRRVAQEIVDLEAMIARRNKLRRTLDTLDRDIADVADSISTRATLPKIMPLRQERRVSHATQH
jgi:type II secretory pathway component PulJ